jgi:hypothetical protein
MNKPIKVLLAAPSYDGKYDVEFIKSLNATQYLATQNNIQILPVYLCYDSLVQRVRNRYFKIAYENDIDALFFIDADIGWKAEDFIKLVLSDKDMIGGGYRKKQDEEELYTFKVKGDTDNTFEITPDNDGLLEVNGLGCGFLKLSKKCVDQLFENEPNYYVDCADDVTKIICDCVVNDQKHFISEDVVLGFKWQNLGGEVYVDTNIELIHSGNKHYTGNVNKWLANWRNKFAEQKQISKMTPEYLSKYFAQENKEDDMFKVL